MMPRFPLLSGPAGQRLRRCLAGCGLLLAASGVLAQGAGSASSVDPATAAGIPPAATMPAATAPAGTGAAAAPVVVMQAPDSGAAAEQAFRRKSLLPLVQPLWSELTQRQQQVLAPFAEQWNTLPVEEKRAWKALAERFPRLSAGERRHAEKRISEWALLTPEQRKLARQNFRLAKELPRDERVAQWEQYQNMTDEQRQVLQHGSTSNTAARHAGSRTALAKEAAQPIAEVVRRNPQSVSGIIKPAVNPAAPAPATTPARPITN